MIPNIVWHFHVHILVMVIYLWKKCLMSAYWDSVAYIPGDNKWNKNSIIVLWMKTVLRQNQSNLMYSVILIKSVSWTCLRWKGNCGWGVENDAYMRKGNFFFLSFNYPNMGKSKNTTLQRAHPESALSMCTTVMIIMISFFFPRKGWD